MVVKEHGCDSKHSTFQIFKLVMFLGGKDALLFNLEIGIWGGFSLGHREGEGNLEGNCSQLLS